MTVQEDFNKTKRNTENENAKPEELEKLFNNNNNSLNNKNYDNDVKSIKNGINKNDNNKNKNLNDDKEKQNDEDITEYLKNMPLTDDTTCGFWIFRGKFLQK